MKKHNILIISLVSLVLILIGYFIFLEQNQSKITTKNNTISTGPTATTVSITTAKPALCSNQYYKTKYDTDGKIVIGWEESKTFISCNQGFTYDNTMCLSKVLLLKDIESLTCVQKLDISWGGPLRFIMPISKIDLKTFSKWNNVEELYVGDDPERSVDKEEINQLLSYFPKLQKLDWSTNLILPQDIDWTKVKELKEIAIPNWSLYNGDLNSWPKSLKNMTLINIYAKFGKNGWCGEIRSDCEVVDINKIKHLTQLEELSLDETSLLGLFYRYKNPGSIIKLKRPDWICNIVKEVTNLKTMNGVIIDRKNFNCDDFLDRILNICDQHLSDHTKAWELKNIKDIKK